MGNVVNIKAFEHFLNRIENGTIFEKFVQALLCEIVGVDFIPIGGHKDRGIDGLQYTSENKKDSKTIYQFSIQADSKSKIRQTLITLQENKIGVSRLFYVTPQLVRDQDILIEEFYEKFNVNVIVYDRNWLGGHINHSEATYKIYASFLENYVHRFTDPGKELETKDFVDDPRVFVFLRQQLDRHGKSSKLDELLIDGLVLYALEGTDPDKNIFMSKDEILSKIQKLTPFDINQSKELLSKRLEVLLERPKKINYHSNVDKYCLPYQTRLEIDEQRISDQVLLEVFTKKTAERLEKHLNTFNLRLKLTPHLARKVFNHIYKQQGFDFANFVLKGDSPETVENELENIISCVLREAGVASSNCHSVGLALQATVRDIIYRGEPEEIEFLQKMSKSYLMLFLLQSEPHVCSYFDTLASNLKVFVCNSLIVPALSEICLEAHNRRHWNLLSNAAKAGVTLYINSATMLELVGHVQRAAKIFEEHYKGLEEYYSDERTLRYVPEILIRAFLYQRVGGRSVSFNSFINKFVSLNTKTSQMVREMSIFLKEEMGIEYIDNKSLGVALDEKEVSMLSAELEKHKPSLQQAEIDAQTFLIIYELRKKHNEEGGTGVMSYKTWWLSKDTTTHRAVEKCFRNEHRASCYLRPDFLLNFISLALSRRQASGVFDEMFPTLAGISISHHVPPHLCVGINKAIAEHKELGSARIKAKIGTMATALMTTKVGLKGKKLEHYIDEELKKA